MITPEFVTIAHELGHARRIRKGATLKVSPSLGDLGVPQGVEEDLWRRPEEFLNIKGTENAVRQDHGISARKYHSGNVQNVRHIKSYQTLGRRVAVALTGVSLPAQMKLEPFPAYRRWIEIPYRQPLPDFSLQQTVQAWTLVVQTIEAIGPTWRQLDRDGLIPEVMYSQARPAVQKRLDKDESFVNARRLFETLLRTGNAAAIQQRAAGIGRVAKDRVIALDIYSAQKMDDLFEDLTF